MTILTDSSKIIRPAKAALIIMIGAAPHFSLALDINVYPSEGQNGIHNALAKIRSARLSSKIQPEESARIILAPGEYFLEAPIVLTEEDSGTAVSPTILMAQQPGTAWLSGAKPLRANQMEKGRWEFNPPQGIDKAIERSGGQFFVNNKRAILARHPDEGRYLFIESADNTSDDASKRRFFITSKDAVEIQRLIENNRDRAQLRAFHSWTASEHRISKITENNSSIEVAPSSKWAFLSAGRSQRFYIQNVPLALNAPGEWIATSAGINYIPTLSDEEVGPEKSIGRFPRNNLLLKISGTPQRHASHIKIDGIGFEYTGIPSTLSGFIDTQAAVKVGAAIEADFANHVEITRCTIQHTAGYGVWLRQGVQNSRVSRCKISDMGAGGIRVGTEVLDENNASLTGKNSLDYNIIDDTGKDFPGAVGIWVGKSSENKLSNNLITRTTYSGISVGWQWGYAPSSAERNEISRNILINIGQGTLSDLGAIYTLGNSPGTTISENIIRNVIPYDDYGPGGWGIYADEGSSSINIYRNIVVGAHSGSFHLHYGRDLIVEDNIFANSAVADILWSNPKKSGAWLLQKNIIAGNSDRGTDLRGASPALNETSPPPAAQKITLTTSPTALDIRIQGKNSKDASWTSVLDAGRKTLKELDANQHNTNVGEVVHQQFKPSSSTFIDFSKGGNLPTIFKARPTTKPELVSIDRESDGGACLALYDGDPGLPIHDPHIFFTTNYKPEGLSIRFSVNLSQDSKLTHELRDDQSPYLVGLSLEFSKNGLVVNGERRSGQLPIDRWIEASISGKGDGTYDVTVAPIGSPAIKVKAARRSRISSINWIGFISNGTLPARTCIKYILIQSERQSI